MRLNRFTLSLLVLLPAATSVLAQKPQSINGAAAPGEMSFSYKFDGARFPLRLIEIDLGPDGAGELRFTRGESDEVVDCKVKLLPATTARIRNLFEVSDFLASSAEYQDKRDFKHMGRITLGAKQGARERKVRFNYTLNPHMKELEEIFRGIASQEISLFDIENAERYQPLDVPKQLEMLENDLKLVRIAEPARLLTALNEIAGDDSQPLIARNHAKRIIEAIKKGNFKSPVKK